MILFDRNVVTAKYPGVGSKHVHRYVGFSGGADSLAAMHFLQEGGWNVTALHIQHFDTPASVAIRTAVSDLCWGRFDLKIVNAQAHGYNFKNGEVNEANAHKIRSKIISSFYDEVILCNHINDLAEGYFMNCQQGFPDRVPLVTRNGNKVRPFLRTKKKDFYRYLSGKSLTHLIVPDDMLSLRGKLRETVFPTLQDDWTSAARKLFIDTRRIYGSS